MRVYLDANIIIDVALHRNVSSIQVFSDIMDGSISGFVGSLSYSICHDVIQRRKSAEYARKFMTEMRDHLKLVEMNEKVLNKSIESQMSDFEDALQYECALKSKSDFLITHNKKDFPSEDWITTPETFLSSLG